MSMKTSAETLWKRLEFDQEIDSKNADAWLVFPAIIGWDPLVGWDPLTSIPTLLDFQMRPIAKREDGRTRIFEPEYYSFLNHLQFIDDVKHELFGGVQGLPNACQMINEWGLVDEIAWRIELFMQDKLPLPTLRSD